MRGHKLTGKTPNFKSNIDRNKIRDKYLENMKIITKDGKAEPYNFKYYTEYKMIDTCSLSTFKTIMKGNLIASPWANKNNISGKETIKKIDEIIDLNSKIYFRKSRPEHEGLIGEVDASKDGTRQSHLHALYEPATKKILALHMEKEETTKGYYEILKQAIKNNTVPRLLKGDCRSSFVINKKQAGALADKDVNTQFGFVLKNIGVEMENSSEPTFKGAVERFFRTAQNQLKGEFREKNITTFDEANKYLKEYMKQLNRVYSIPAQKQEIKYKEVKLNDRELNNLLSIRSFRKTDKANAFSYKNTLYSLFDLKNNRVSFKEKVLY